MSGLVAWVDTGTDLTAERVALAAMSDALRHRGPETTSWSSPRAALAHRHRAGGDDASPAGPMVHRGGGGPDDAVVAVLAGRVTGIAALRAALGPSEPAEAGTPLLLRAYLRWGPAFVERLGGAFALAVWDGRRRTLVLARDRLGVRPLYYHRAPGRVLVASEPKAIMANDRFRPVLDVDAVLAVLQPRLALPGETPLRDLEEVPPAHVVELTDDRVTRTRYWALASAPHRDPFPDTVARVRALLADAVIGELDGPGPYAALLSGGVDSTSVTGLAAGALGGLDTFCLEFPDDPSQHVSTELRPDVDAPYAAAAAASLGCRHHAVPVRVADLFAGLDAVRRVRDLPGWGQFDASMYLLFGRVREHAADAVTGEAADEIFGGYPYLLEPTLVDRDDFPWMGDGPRLADYLSAEVTARVDPREDAHRRYRHVTAGVPRLNGEDPGEARVRAALFHGMAGPLAVILDRMERMSMAHGVDVRFPFCDHRLVEYVWNVPWAMKSHGGVKGLLKAAVGDVVPAGSLTRRKSAYPHAHHAEYEKSLVARTGELLDDDGSTVAWLFDRPRMRALVDALATGESGRLPGGISGPQLLVQVVELDEWIREYGVSIA